MLEPFDISQRITPKSEIIQIRPTLFVTVTQAATVSAGLIFDAIPTSDLQLTILLPVVALILSFVGIARYVSGVYRAGKFLQDFQIEKFASKMQIFWQPADRFWIKFLMLKIQKNLPTLEPWMCPYPQMNINLNLYKAALEQSCKSSRTLILHVGWFSRFCDKVQEFGDVKDRPSPLNSRAQEY